MKNLVVKGDLHLSAGIGEGDINLKNVKVEGTTIVNGGGENSVIFENTTLDELIIFKANGKIRVVTKGNTNIANTKLESGAKLEQKENTGLGFKNVEVIVVKSGELVEFDGNFKEIQIRTNVDVKLTEDCVIGRILVDEEAAGTKINAATGTKIKDIVLNGDTEISGEGIIEKAVVNTSGTTIEKAPKTINLGDGVNKVVVGGEDVTESTKSKSSGGSADSDGGYEPTLPTFIGDAVTELVFTETGNNIDSHKLGFLPPVSYIEQPDNFQGWLLMYSKSDISQVWDNITGLTSEQLAVYTDTASTNRIYQITTYDWADGIGNTMRPAQKDVVTGAEFGPGLYHFHVATYTTDGIVGLKEVNQTLDIKPAPRDLTVTGDGTNITGYEVNYSSYNDERIVENFIFYSQSGIYDIEALILNKTRAEVQELASSNKGILTSDLTGPITFDTEQTEIDGTVFGEGLYYVYAATISNNGVLGLSWAKEMMVTDSILEVPTTPIGDENGTALPAGGATSSSSSESADFYEHIRTAAGGGTPRIAIFSSSRDTFDTVYNHYYFDDPTYGSLENNFTTLGFQPVFVPVSIDNKYFYADHPYFAALVKTCDAVFLQGGDQNKHAKSLLNDNGTDTELMKAIRYVYDRGGVVSGTSAGMAVMGEFAYGYGVPDVVLHTNQTEEYTIADIPTAGDLFPEIDNNNLTVPGIGLVPISVLNDTHFDARGRLGRLVVALRDTGKEIGIGADEGTGLAVKDNIGEVVGNHGIFIVDTSEANYELSGSENTFGVTGLKIHYLTVGDKFNFDNKEVIVADNKTAIVEDASAELYETENIFAGNYETTKQMISLANSNESTSEGKVKTSGEPFFKAIFSKDVNTKSYTSDSTYLDENLAGYKKTSIIGMTLDVVEDESLDVTAPVISGIDPSSDPYKVYIMITDDKSGIDESTINQTTVTIQSDVNTIYSTSPQYELDYYDIKVSINEDEYISGDRITINGVADLAGNVVETQTWEFDGTVWSRVEEIIELSTDASLSGITLNTGMLTTAFNSGDIYYDITVANSVYNIDITPTATHENATITVNEVDTVSGAVYNMPLNLEDNTVNIIVTAEDKETTKLYTFSIHNSEPLVLSVTQSNSGAGARLFIEFKAGGIDETTLTSSNITITGNDYWADEPNPYIDPDYPNEITVEGDADFQDGNIITITPNVTDLEGNPFIEFIWKRVDGSWIKE